MKRQKVTMRDVASQANVSLNTVSLALKDSDLVHPDTKALVMQVVKELGYTPNVAAANLRQGTVGTIGLMIPDMHNPHFWDIAEGVENEARRHGSAVVVTSTNLDRERELGALQGLLERRYDGLILATHFTQDVHLAQFHAFQRHERPIVTFARELDGMDRILYYRKTAGLLLLEHLYQLGHRRIGLVLGVAREGLADERLRAYREFTQSHNLPDLVERCGATVSDSTVATHRLLDLSEPPTAILSVNDYLALGVYRAANQRGLRIPHDLSVGGFDNTSLAPNLAPSLTSVDVGGTLIGQLAAQLVFARMAEPSRPPQTMEIPAQLVVRESTAGIHE